VRGRADSRKGAGILENEPFGGHVHATWPPFPMPTRGQNEKATHYPPLAAARYNRNVALTYNIVMLAVDIVAILLLRRSRGLLASLIVVGCAGVVALMLGGVLGWRFEDHFGVMRLWTYGIFSHGPILLAATAALWRRSRPWLACGAALGAAALLVLGAHALLIEPHWLDVSHRRIASSKIHKPVRIVVVADLQTDSIGPYERRVLQQTLDEKPDIILWAGDYLQTSWKRQELLRRDLRDLLREMGFTPPSGMFAVQGNCDPTDWPEIFEGSGVTTVNVRRTFDLGDIRLTCLSLAESGDPRLAVANATPDRFHLVLGHKPNFALGQIDADLLVAGHTHGGQVRLPIIGPLITLSLVPRAWAAGLTELPRGGKLLVSRGLGMERGYAPRIRFLCRPELVVIDLVPEEKETADEGREAEK
jgi:uncharacterized protein